jgi:hypothetical protein
VAQRLTTVTVDLSHGLDDHTALAGALLPEQEMVVAVLIPGDDGVDLGLLGAVDPVVLVDVVAVAVDVGGAFELRSLPRAASSRTGSPGSKAFAIFSSCTLLYSLW